MYVVIFKAKLKYVDQAYYETAKTLRQRAYMFGCSRFESYSESGWELTLSYWPDRESIKRWGQDPDHQQAQLKGATHWYAEHFVDIAKVETINPAHK